MENNFECAKKVLVVSSECDGEALAIRDCASVFGALTTFAGIGRPSDFISVLSGQVVPDADIVILCAHGDNGAFLMPELADEVYYDGEPRNIDAETVSSCLALKEKLIVSTACTTGTGDTARRFSETGNDYVAPCDYIEGSAAFFFTVRFLYEHLALRKSARDAFVSASESDPETKLFRFFPKGKVTEII